MARAAERTAYRQMKNMRKILDEMLQAYDGKLPDTKKELKSFVGYLVSELDGAMRKSGFEPYPLIVRGRGGKATTLDKVLNKGKVRKRE